MTYKYDVCLSFAGEQRPYVEQVAQHLKSLDVKYFYDKEQAVSLWGHDLIETFDEVFGRDSRFCVMFISQDYAAKVWTRHEKRSILERQLNEKSPYVLPVRFDSTRLSGLASTIHYQDAMELTPEQLSEMIYQRIKGTQASSEKEALPKPSTAEFRLPKNQKSKLSTYAVMSQLIDDTVRELRRRGEALEVNGTPFFYRETAGRHMFRFGSDNGSPIYSLDMWMGGGLGGDDGLAIYGIPGKPYHNDSGTTNGWGSITQDKAGAPLLQYSGIGDDMGDQKAYTTPEFIELMWNYICDQLEG